MSHLLDAKTEAHSRSGLLYHPNFSPAHSSVLSLIAGPFANQVVSIWGEKDGVHEYLSAPDRRRHVWHCWLAAKPDATGAYEFLSRSKSKQIVNDAFGSCPIGMIGMLGRLGQRSRKAKFYPSLFEIVQRGGTVAQWLSHQTAIQDDVIGVLSRIESDDLAQRAIPRLLARSVEPRWFSAIIWLIRRLEVLSPDTNPSEAILNSKDPIRSAHKMTADLPFPPAPWERMGMLKPVESSAELAALAKRYRNCLSDRDRWINAAVTVQTGRRYYYHWAGEQPALLMFARIGMLGWSLHEAAGPDNSTFSTETEREIQATLCSVPEVWPIDPN